MVFVALYLKESRDFSEQHQTGEIRPTSGEAIWRVVSHANEPASRLIWIYADRYRRLSGKFFSARPFSECALSSNEQTSVISSYVGAISVFARVLLLGRAVDRLGEANLSRLGLILLAAGVVGMPLSRNLPMLAIAVAMIPLGTAFTFPCVTALLSRVTKARERGLYMGLQQTLWRHLSHHRTTLLRWTFDHIGVSAPYFFSSAFILATVSLGFGLDKYARPSR